MKKSIRILLLASILLTISACTFLEEPAPPPRETVSAFFYHVRVEEFDKANRYILGEAPVSLYEIGAGHSGVFRKLSYTYISEIIEGDRAQVTIRVSTIDFTQIMESVIAEAFFWVFKDITQEELYELVNETLIEKLNEEDVPILEKQVEMTLILNGIWRIMPSDEFFDGITGGILSFAEYAAGWS